jgi:hypothetical protein
VSLVAGVTPRRILLAATVVLAVLLVVTVYAFRDDILKASIDPKAPFQTYRPPPPADYAKRSGWALAPADMARATAADPPVDVFFVHSTTYDSPAQWNAPLTDERSQHELQTVMLPNYAGPFARVGRVFAPQYREATLFSLMTFRDDAQDARRLAYDDVRNAFEAYLQRYNDGRPFILAGGQEGGLIVARLLEEVVARDPAIRRRLVAAYLIDTPAPASVFGPGAAFPACRARGEAHCVVGWTQIVGAAPGLASRRLERAVWWTEGGDLKSSRGEAQLCVNPLLGVQTDQAAPRRLNLGAANATGLEWGARPAFLSREVSARCVGGVLEVSPPNSGSLKPSGSWTDRKKAPDFNLFYADLEADAEARVKAFEAAADKPAR